MLYKLSLPVQDLASRIYEGHWEYGVSHKADQQFDDQTVLYRRIWEKESRAWLSLAKAWRNI
jgi:hypothetical protein